MSANVTWSRHVVPTQPVMFPVDDDPRGTLPLLILGTFDFESVLFPDLVDPETRPDIRNRAAHTEAERRTESQLHAYQRAFRDLAILWCFAAGALVAVVDGDHTGLDQRALVFAGDAKSIVPAVSQCD